MFEIVIFSKGILQHFESIATLEKCCERSKKIVLFSFGNTFVIVVSARVSYSLGSGFWEHRQRKLVRTEKWKRLEHLSQLFFMKILSLILFFCYKGQKEDKFQQIS